MQLAHTPLYCCNTFALFLKHVLSFVTNTISSCKYLCHGSAFPCLPTLRLYAMQVSAGSHLSGFWVGKLSGDSFEIITEYKRVNGCIGSLMIW